MKKLNILPLRRKKQPVHAMVENTYAGSYVFIPEINGRIKISEGSSLREWIIRYCENNPEMKPMFSANHNIPELCSKS